MKFANRQQFGKVLRRRVSPVFRENDAPLRLSPDAELMCEIIVQAFDDSHYAWFFDPNSFFFEICELLGINPIEIQEMAMRGNRKFYHMTHKGAIYEEELKSSV